LVSFRLAGHSKISKNFDACRPDLPKAIGNKVQSGWGPVKGKVAEVWEKNDRAALDESMFKEKVSQIREDDWDDWAAEMSL
jgi:hypothetical protein